MWESPWLAYCSQPLGNTYSSTQVEAGWYDWWLQRGFFTPSGNVTEDWQVFSMLLPPPNVTGNLHLGHALTGAIQDVIVRWRHETLWVPGTDHAGIATHVVVEKQLRKEHGKTRHDLGREGFIKEIWKWKQEHGHNITEQMQTLGLSLDWTREYFTMDERLNLAVTEAFCRLFDLGLIYRDKRMINWSCALRSSLSDIEVDSLTLEGPTTLKMPGLAQKVKFGILSHFAYPSLLYPLLTIFLSYLYFKDERVVVATTRLETMLADVAVAVNPDDPRYSHLIGQTVVHPLDKGRQLPIIADTFVDMKFGTGAVKITPGHDRVDYEVGCRHGLPVLEILSDDGTICKHVELVGGLHRLEARDKVKEALSVLGYYCGEKGHPTVLPLCSRTGDVVEPRLKEQWFLNCREMSQKAIEAVESGQLKIIPQYNEKIWSEFLKSTHDWCLSRQLWWGHRIPVYTCANSNVTVCARSEVEAREKLEQKHGLRSVEVVQDADVLDTWFSSSLLPFSTFGWPTRQISSSIFPQTLLETGQDILFFWVARMVMLSLQLTGQVPFKQVLLHGMIRDAQGRKMSKSLGNVIDPVDVIQGASLQDLNSRLDKGNLDPREIQLAKAGQKKLFPKGIPCCGADALRLTLCSYNLQNADINFDVIHAESKLRFCNKIWQSFRFIFSKLQPAVLLGPEDSTDLWILSRLSSLVQSCDTHFQSYSIHLATAALQQFWHHELCDVYLEAVKPVFIGQDEKRQEAVRQVLAFCSQTFLYMIAPFMPFLSEELFQRLQPFYTRKQMPWPESICVAPFPRPSEYPWHSSEIEGNMAHILSIARHVQQMRTDYSVLGNKIDLYLETNSGQIMEAVSSHHSCLLVLSRSSSITMLRPGDAPPAGCPSVYVNPEVRVFMKLQGGAADIDKEKERLHKKISKLEASKDELSAKLEKLQLKGKTDQSAAFYLKDKMTAIDSELNKLSQMMSALSSTSELH
ncbi:unnamed protein product [Candidula unifasciata]|uniref:Valine--tRNA ligase, mitochondrial n=1 Tax=Candidula unifasciata TaxID=100452 RepID=A0A8S3Z467_9EUPU|nr:unnamed protein product [Candidula unifasciata]